MAFDAGSLSGIASGAGSALSSINTMMLAQQQAARAKDLRDKSGKVKLNAIQQEYLDAQKKADMRALGTMPGYDATKEAISSTVPNMVRVAQMSAKDNSDILAAALNANVSANNSLNQLATTNATWKDNANKEAITQDLNVAAAKEAKVALQTDEKRRLETAAGNLENASTANRAKGATSLITSIASMFGAGSMGAVTGAMAKGTQSNTDNSTPITPTANTFQTATNPTEQVDNQNEALRLNQLTDGTNPTDNTQFGTPLQMPDLNKDYASASQQEVQQLQAYLKSKGYQINPTGTLDNQTIQALQDHKQGLQKFAMFGNNYTD